MGKTGYLARHLPATLIEGFFAGLGTGILLNYLLYPLVLLLIGLYTAWRAGYVHRLAFLISFSAGILTGLLWFAQADMVKKLAGGVVIPVLVILAYHLSSGVFFFATYSRSRQAWIFTCIWALIFGGLAGFASPGSLVVIVLPLLWLCLLPLWCADLRLIHALVFALLYLATIYLGWWHRPVYFIAESWPVWVATLGLAMVPEILSRLYPERRHDLDSLPVMTPTLNIWEKLVAIEEALFLMVDLYGLFLQKYDWFSKIGKTGGYLVILGVLMQVFSSVNWHSLLLQGLAIFFFVTGIMLELGRSNYSATALYFALYGLALGVTGGFFTNGFNLSAIGWGVVLIILSVIFWYGKPKETKEEMEKWKELNRL